MAWRVVFSLRCIRCLAAAAAAFLAPLTIWAEEQAASPRVDLYGDPLPEGAIARLGSTRFSNSVKSPIRACTYTPDGRQIASITSDGKLQFWDRSSGYETRELEVDRPAPHEPRAPIDDRAFRRDVNIAIAPDGNLVAIAWWGRGRIEIRELRAGNSVASITTRRRSPARAPSLVFSSDGRRLIAVEAGQLEIFDLKGEPVGPPLPPRSRIAISQTRDVMLTKDDVKITTTPTRLELRDGATGGLQRELDAVDGAELMSGIAINARATKFAAAFGKTRLVDNRQRASLKLFSLPDQSVLAEYKLPFKTVTDLRFLSADREVALEAHGEVFVWNLAGKKAAGPLDIAGDLARFQFAADGREFARASGGTRVSRWRAPGWDEAEPGHDKPIESIALSADGKIAATCAADRAVRLWDTDTGRQLRKIPKMSAAHVAISPNGATIAFVALGVPTIHTIEPWTEVQTRSEELITSLGFSSDSNWLALGGKRTVTIVHAATGEVRARLPVPDETDVDDAQRDDPQAAQLAAIYAVQFSNSGKLLAASVRGVKTQGLVVWNLSGDQTTATWARYHGSAAPLSFSSDDALLAVADADDEHRRSVTVINTATGEPRFIRIRGSQSRAVALVRGGQILLSAEIDSSQPRQGSIAFYDLVAGESLGVLPPQSLWPSGFSVSTDERRMAVSCNDGTALILDLQEITHALGVPSDAR